MTNETKNGDMGEETVNDDKNSAQRLPTFENGRDTESNTRDRTRKINKKTHPSVILSTVKRANE